MEDWRVADPRKVELFRLPCYKAQLIAARRGVSLPVARGPAHREGGTGARCTFGGAGEWTVKLASYSVRRLREPFCRRTAPATQVPRRAGMLRDSRGNDVDRAVGGGPCVGLCPAPRRGNLEHFPCVGWRRGSRCALPQGCPRGNDACGGTELHPFAGCCPSASWHAWRALRCVGLAPGCRIAAGLGVFPKMDSKRSVPLSK